MKRLILAGCFLAAFLCGDVIVVLGSSEPIDPYTSILARNVFALKSPAPNVSVAPPAALPPKIKLTGITTILGGKLALLKCSLPVANGSPAREESYILGEGQRAGLVAVLSIDEKAGVVQVDDFGTTLNVSFEK
jgi:hypothetical protein